MAESSKTLYCGNYPYPSNNNYTLKVSWSESSPNIANNTSVVSITGSIGSSNTAWDSYYNSYLKLYWYDNNTGKETLVATSAGFLSCGPGYGGTRSVSKTITVTHKSDGSLSGYAKVAFEAGSTSGGYSPASNNVATSTLALTTIARASDFSYSAGTELGQAITMTINRKSDAFTHKVEYSFAGSDAITVGTEIDTSASFTPAVSLATNIPNSTVGSLTMKVTTFNGSTQIGDPVTKSVDLSVPSSVVPTMGNPTATRVDNGIPSGWGVYVKGYSKVTIAMTSVSGSYGSTIKSYSISGPNLSSTSSSATSNVLVTDGTNTYTCRITDSRGRTAEKTVSINVADYSLPSIKATAVRCSSDGSANKNGTYLKVKADWNIASVSSKNSVSSRSVSCNGVSNTSFSDNTAFVLAANCSIGSSYTLTASVTDALGNSSTATVSIPTSSRVMNVRKNKDGLAIGKFSERAGFEVDWNSYFNGTVDINGKLTGNNAKLNGSLEVGGVSTLNNDLVVNRVLEKATPIPSNADLNTVAYLKIRQYYCGTNSGALTLTNSPTNYAFKMFVNNPNGDGYDNESQAWICRVRILIDVVGEIWIQKITSESTAGSFIYGSWHRILDNTNYKKIMHNDLLVKEVELTSTATSITIDGLDLLSDKQYEFEVIGGQSAYSDWWVRFNGDASNKYYMAGRYDNGDNHNANAELSKNSGYRPASSGFYYALGLGPIGIVRGRITYVKSNKTAVMEWETRDVGNVKQLIASVIGLYDKDISSTNLTSVTFAIKTSGVTFSVGTRFIIRKVV